ncbi:nucleotide pyrophosphohydrolase [Candidatus Micrarchaeota archaeon]|nr:nucleotide pyrophosphohydrolase [Candidatus Micrarchaeota archaeon]
MDSETTINELKTKVKEFCDARNWNHTAKDLSIGVITESSELLEIFRFKTEDEVRELFEGTKRGEIVEEMADVFHFLLLMSSKYEVDLAEALEKKLEKNESRYPVEKAFGNSKKYTEL